MGAEWVGVIGGLVGGVVGVSGSVIVQWLGDRQRRAIAREQWAEERKVRYRDERKVAYESFLAGHRDLLTALREAGQSGVRQVRPGAQNDSITAAADALKPIMDELNLIGSAAVRSKALEFWGLLSELRHSISLVQSGTDREEQYGDWAQDFGKIASELLKSAVVDLT